MKKFVLSTLMALACIASALCQTADKPFAGKWEIPNITAHLNLYSPSPDRDTGEMTYGFIEVITRGASHIDTHFIIEVVEIEGNTAVVKYSCSFDFDEQPRTATLTYNPATGSLTIINEEEVSMCRHY